MLTLTDLNLNINSGTIVCTIVCSVLGQGASLTVPLVEADVIAFNNGAVPWTEATVQGYLATQGVTVALPAGL